MAYYFAAVAIIFALTSILQVRGQPTEKDCKDGDHSKSIASDVNRDAIRQLNIQVQSIRKLLTEMKTQQDTVIRSLQKVGRRSQEQDGYTKRVQSIHKLLRASIQEMKNQKTTAMRSLRAVDRLSQKQVQSIQDLLNKSFQQIKQQASARRRLNLMIRRLHSHETPSKTKLGIRDKSQLVK